MAFWSCPVESQPPPRAPLEPLRSGPQEMTSYDTKVRSFQMKARADRQIGACCPLGLAVAEGGPHRCSWGWLEPRLLGPAPRHRCQSFEPVPNPRASQNQLTDTGPACSGADSRIWAPKKGSCPGPLAASVRLGLSSAWVSFGLPCLFVCLGAENRPEGTQATAERL